MYFVVRVLRRAGADVEYVTVPGTFATDYIEAWRKAAFFRKMNNGTIFIVVEHGHQPARP